MLGEGTILAKQIILPIYAGDPGDKFAIAAIDPLAFAFFDQPSFATSAAGAAGSLRSSEAVPCVPSDALAPEPVESADTASLPSLVCSCFMTDEAESKPFCPHRHGRNCERGDECGSADDRPDAGSTDTSGFLAHRRPLSLYEGAFRKM